MEITAPTDCGNAPRIGIVTDFITWWAGGDTEQLSEWLTDEASWTIAGQEPAEGAIDLSAVVPAFTVAHVDIRFVITHGRLASCDGTVTAGDTRLDFSHALRFASTAKTAKIAEVRSYLVPGV